LELKAVSFNELVPVCGDMNEVLRFGAEYMFGQRVNANDADGIANRLQFMAMYTFKEVVV